MSKAEEYIWKKVCGRKLTKQELYTIVGDIKNEKLSKLETSLFLSNLDAKGMDMDELEHLTRALADSGEKIRFDEPVYDKHSIGGVPGSKISLLVVPIVASYDMLIPKISSRAITSSGGTADIAEVLMPVEFSAEEFRGITYKTRGAIAHGGSLNLAPVGDMLIDKVAFTMEKESNSQMIASIMAKKLCVGARNVVIDIPVGSVKSPDMTTAEELAYKFKTLGDRLEMNVGCIITYGSQPIGRTVGPALEAREAVEALYHCGPLYESGEPFSLTEKATAVAGVLLTMAGKSSDINIGKDYANKALCNGMALKKMREIIEAQGGDPDVKPEDIQIGEYRYEIKAHDRGYVRNINNSAITKVARAAGAPRDKGAGVVLYGKENSKMRKGDVIMEIYAERESKLTDAIRVAKTLKPIAVEGIMLEYI